MKRVCCLFLAVIFVFTSSMLLSSCSTRKDKNIGTSEEKYVNFEEGFTETKILDEVSAIEAVDSVASELNLTEPKKELKVDDVSAVNNDKYYRMQQYYQNLLVYGCSVVVSADEEGNAMALTANTVKINNSVKMTPNVSVEKVNETIKMYYKELSSDGSVPDVIVEELKKEDLILYPVADEVKLAYIIRVGFYKFIVDANSGEILKSIQLINEDSSVTCYNADGTEEFKGYYYENTSLYAAYNKKRGITVYNYLGENSEYEADCGERLESSDKYFGNVVKGNTEEEDKKYSDGVILMNNISKIYDYFNDKFSEIAYGEMYACYNDGFDDGENALGGSIGDIGYISMGSVTGVNALDTMAHEYTHVVSRKKVDWISINAWDEQTDEPGAINEAYSDIFGELIEAEIKGTAPDWEHGDRIIHNPMSNNYPAAIGDKEYENFRDDMWGMATGGGYYTDYSHGFSTIVSHSAYLMWNGIDGTASKKLTEDELAELWYRGLLLLHADATFTQCANSIILSAQQMYRNQPDVFTIDKLRCVEEAFAEVKITANATAPLLVENGATIYVMDSSKDKYYDDYHIKVEKINLATREQETVIEEDVNYDNGYEIDLAEDTYVLTVTDNAEKGSEYAFSKTIKVVEYSDETAQMNLNRVVYIYTNFKLKIPVTDFSIPKAQIITLGELGIIEPEISPADANGYFINWSSSDESVATISSAGKDCIISTHSKGTTVITAELMSGEKTFTKTMDLRVASKGRDTVLVLDVSGSMGGDPLYEMKEAAMDFCTKLLEDEYNNRVGIVFFDDDIYTMNLTNDIYELTTYISEISDGGTTNMEAGLAEAEDMLDIYGAEESIKNIVVMADGLPNEGKTSYSGSFHSDYYDTEYANAVVDTAERIKNKYNMYSLGFFHNLYDEEFEFGEDLMQLLTNQEDGYHQVEEAENLQFAFGDISEEISDGSKIVINIACPVDVTITHNGETLSSAQDSYNDKTSFGILQLLGSDQDIKVVSLEPGVDYDIQLFGTGTGEMNYSINYLDSDEKVIDSREFVSVPITSRTKITSNTNNTAENVDLNIDEDGDGEIDVIWSAGKNAKGFISFDRIPDLPEIEVDTEPEGNTTWVIILSVVFMFIIAGVIVLVIILSTRRKPESEQIEVPAEHDEHKETQETEEKEPIYGPGIVILKGPLAGAEIPIQKGEVIYLGKDAKKVHIVFTKEYTNVSRVHCSIYYDEKSNKYFVTDCSSNGTFYKNRTRMEKGKRVSVMPGTILLLANEQATIQLK